MAIVRSSRSYSWVEIFCFLFIATIPLQNLSGAESDGSPSLKIYNLTFVFLLVATILSPQRKSELPSGFHFAFPLQNLLIFLYLMLVLASVFWAGDSKAAFMFSIKYLFVGVEFFLVFFLILKEPAVFCALRAGFEFSGVYLALLLFHKIATGGLISFLMSSFSGSDTSGSRSDYFSNIGLTFGGGKNLLGSWFAIVALLAFIHYMLEKPFKKRSKKYFVVGAFGLSFLGMWLTISRTAILGFLIGVSIFIYKTYRVKTILYVAILLGILAGTMALLFQDSLGSLDFFTSHLANVGSSEDAGSLGRLTLWSIASEVILDNFIAGVGVGNGAFEIWKYPSDHLFGEDNFHNLYLQNFVEFGVLGFSLLCCIWVYTLWSIFRSMKGYCSWQLKEYLVSSLCVFAALTIMGLFQYKGGDPEIWLFLAVTSGLVSHTRLVNQRTIIPR